MLSGNEPNVWLSNKPALHLQRLSPKTREQDIRNFLGGFNFHGEMAMEPIRYFSGGEKARLALAIVVWQRPNLLLLDEPTNHLDLEMCHALTVALQAFEGAVIVVSHDRHLLRNTVDQFLLVAHGKAEPFEGDLDDYSRWLTTQSKVDSSNSDNNTNGYGKVDKKVQRQQAAVVRKKLGPINNAIKKIEQQMAKTDQQLKTIETALGDNSLYEADNKDKLQQLLRDQAKLVQQKDQQEEDWLKLNDELEGLHQSL